MTQLTVSPTPTRLASRVAGSTASMRSVFRHQLARTRNVWAANLAAGLALPTLTLLAIGAGLGSQIDAAELARLGVDSYINYIGPGLLVVTAMQIASTESMWSTMGLLRWQGVYKAVLATPITSAELGVGHTLWIGFRGLVAASCFLLVLAIAGTLSSPLAILIAPVALLVAVVHAAPLVALTVGLEQENLYPMFNRMIIFPLYLFSGAFFPVDDMPSAVAAFAKLTPTWHGVEAARDLATGATSNQTIGHVCYLAALGVFGLLLVRRQFRKHLEL